MVQRLCFIQDHPHHVKDWIQLHPWICETHTADGMTSVVSSSTSFWRVSSSCSEFLRLSNSRFRNLEEGWRYMQQHEVHKSHHEKILTLFTVFTKYKKHKTKPKHTVILSRWSDSWLCTASAAPPGSPAPFPFAASLPPCPAASGPHTLQSQPPLWDKEKQVKTEATVLFQTQVKSVYLKEHSKTTDWKTVLLMHRVK